MFVTLMYHIVDDAIADAIAVSRAAFAAQMAWLRAEGYHALTVAEAAAIAQGAQAAPPRAVLITFDDGYVDNVTTALPILAHHELRATLFVISACIGLRNRWNPKACYDAWHLDWAGLRAWLAAGGDIGGHSHEHLCMTRLAADELAAAVRVNKEVLEEGLGRTLVGFSYPYGVYNAAVKEAVRAHYAIAFSDTAGVWPPAADPWAINRIGVRPEWSLEEFGKRVAVMGRLALRLEKPA